MSVSITQSQPPFAGDPYTLTCTITQEGQTIEWIDSDGNVINSGNGIEVGETMSGSGVTTRTLTFTNLRSNDTGRYTCRNPIRDATQRLITGCTLINMYIQLIQQSSHYVHECILSFYTLVIELTEHCAYIRIICRTLTCFI